MSEFEKELDAKIKSGEIMEERYKNGCIVSYFASFKDIVSTFKDWQPPKPLVVVPQIVADYIETQKDNDFDRVGTLVYGHYKAVNRGEEYYEFNEWIACNFDTFLEAIVNGYTVEKEKMYTLKHIDLSGQYKNESFYLAHSRYAKLKHVSFLKDVDMSEIEQCHFTQEEMTY